MSMNILNSKVIRMFPGTIQSDFLLGFQILAGESLPLTIKQWKYYTIISLSKSCIVFFTIFH